MVTGRTTVPAMHFQPVGRHVVAFTAAFRRQYPGVVRVLEAAARRRGSPLEVQSVAGVLRPRSRAQSQCSVLYAAMDDVELESGVELLRVAVSLDEFICRVRRAHK